MKYLQKFKYQIPLSVSAINVKVITDINGISLKMYIFREIKTCNEDVHDDYLQYAICEQSF